MIAKAHLHAELSELIAEYFARVDRLVDRSAADVFAPLGKIHLGTLIREGREEIADYFRSRVVEAHKTRRQTRHVFSNLVVETQAERTASVRLQCLVFAAAGEFPLPSAAPATIADFSADCVRIDGAWFLAKLRGQTTFSGANAASFAR